MIAAQARQAAVNLFIRFLDHEVVEKHLAKWLKQQQQSVSPIINSPSPYYSYETTPDTSLRNDIVFLTSRFRSGSTALWNIFRESNGFTAYYEPFNERQWFNYAKRGNKVDQSHLGVSDYWKEYEGLDELGSLYSESWIDTNLHMDASYLDLGMKKYIEKLIEHAPERPVLQFNRIDFRLPWIRKNFPNAKLIHLYRNPREQWLSFLTDKELMNSRNVQNTYKDGFYLDIWCNDLERFFPFLSKSCTPHPYQRFYYIWKLSYLYGKKYSDLSISMEQLTHKTTETIKEIEKILYNGHNHKLRIDTLRPPQLDKWKEYANTDWFRTKEAECEKVLSDFLNRDIKIKSNEDLVDY